MESYFWEHFTRFAIGKYALLFWFVSFTHVSYSCDSRILLSPSSHYNVSTDALMHRLIYELFLIISIEVWDLDYRSWSNIFHVQNTLYVPTYIHMGETRTIRAHTLRAGDCTDNHLTARPDATRYRTLSPSRPMVPVIGHYRPSHFWLPLWAPGARPVEAGGWNALWPLPSISPEVLQLWPYFQYLF